jgi:hypothetical protein
MFLTASCTGPRWKATRVAARKGISSKSERTNRRTLSPFVGGGSERQARQGGATLTSALSFQRYASFHIGGATTIK